MKTLEEAIAHAREKAKEQRYYANFEKRGSMVQSCLQCAEEHEQLSKWLEKLKDYEEMNLYEPQHFTKEQSKWIKSTV